MSDLEFNKKISDIRTTFIVGKFLKLKKIYNNVKVKEQVEQIIKGLENEVA